MAAGVARRLLVLFPALHTEKEGINNGLSPRGLAEEQRVCEPGCACRLCSPEPRRQPRLGRSVSVRLHQVRGGNHGGVVGNPGGNLLLAGNY